MTHPNQSFIDNFLKPIKKNDSNLAEAYTQKFIENKRKEKFDIFLKNYNKIKKSPVSEEVLKILNYNTLSSVKNKNNLILESKQSMGSLPQQFSYNGLLYAFNQELNVFVNQYGHTIEPTQASAFMDLAIGNFDPSDMDASDTESDGGAPIILPSVIAYPEAPSGFTASIPTSSGTTLSWTDNSELEDGFKVFYYTQT